MPSTESTGADSTLCSSKTFHFEQSLKQDRLISTAIYDDVSVDEYTNTEGIIELSRDSNDGLNGNKHTWVCTECRSQNYSYKQSCWLCVNKKKC